jgi:diguanylate cyclase (GGDEF)-like protein
MTDEVAARDSSTDMEIQPHDATGWAEPALGRAQDQVEGRVADRRDLLAESVVLAATRALLRVDSRDEAVGVLHAAVVGLGGWVEPARLADADVIPVEVSLGVGEPRTARGGDAATNLRLARHLPTLVGDTRCVAARCDRIAQQVLYATVDPVTGVSSRGEIERRLDSASVGDVVCLLDLDGFKNVNDTLGHIAGDDALHLFGSLLRSMMRDADFVGRYGGDEFMVIMEAVPPDVARKRMRTLTTAWASEDIHQSTVSAGLASVDDLGAGVARSAADRALYRAKRLGGNQVAVATPEEYVSHDRVTRSYQLSQSVTGSIPK